MTPTKETLVKNHLEHLSLDNKGSEYRDTILFITIFLFFIFINMIIKYGIDFPFRDSVRGDFFSMTETPEREIRANLIHLLLTRKGSRYFLPEFGTRLYEFIFDQNDMISHTLIEEEIRDGVKKFIPNLDINSINILPADQDPDEDRTFSQDEDERLFRVSDASNKPYTAKVKIDYTVNNGAFSSSDFIIINI